MLNELLNLLGEVANFIRNNQAWSALVILYAAVAFYVALTTFNEVVVLGESTQYAIARGAGAVIKNVLIPSITIPVSNMLYTKIAGNPVINKLFDGRDYRIASHKLIALVLAGASGLHTITHYWHNPENFLTQPGVTGMTMLASFAVPLSGMYYFHRHIPLPATLSYGIKVMGAHRLGASVFLTAYAFHTPDLRLAPYALLSVGGWLADSMFQRLHRTYRADVDFSKSWIVPETDFVQLAIKKPHQFQVYPGQYVRLAFPNVAGFLGCSHPFTIARNEENHLQFVIKKIGPWTNKISRVIQASQWDSTPIHVQMTGPFSSSLAHFNPYVQLTFIASGVGYTPLMSYLQCLSEKRIATDLKMHIVERAAAHFSPLIASLAESALRSHGTNEVHFYITGTESPDESLLKLQACNSQLTNARSLIFFNADKRPNADTIKRRKSPVVTFFQTHVALHFGRPNLKEIVEMSGKHIAVCGNHELTETVSRLSSAYGKTCYKENF